MLASNLNEILDNFDFTDSIITCVEWADNLIDLIITVDYYWDIQDGRDDTRLLKLVFKNCINANFKASAELPINNDITSADSLFTIVLFKEIKKSEHVQYRQNCVEIFTTDYSIPWLTVVCSEVFLVEK